MLSCEKVQELLPGLLTGEETTHEVREHLAACDACREARDDLARELGAMREDLAALAPSPFLEDAVVEAAHDTESVEPTRRPWRYVVVAFAAAAALFLVVLLPRLQEGGANGSGGVPGGEGDEKGELVKEAGAIFVPPSVGEVGKARKRNARALALQGGKLEAGLGVETTLASGGELFSTAETFPPTAAEAHHRFVYGDPGGHPGDRTCTMATLPSVEGVFFLGNGLLEAIGGTLHAGTTGEILVGDKHWSTTPGTMQGEITVGSPDDGGAEARVRVLVSTGYSGTLLLEEPLAYALGLHQFEIPGDVDFRSTSGETIPIEGRRARARVRIPELDFDQVVEVQVVRERPWMVKRGRRRKEVGLLFPRLQPTSVVRGSALHGLPEGGYDVERARVDGHGDGLEHVEIREGTWRLFLGFEARKTGAVPLLPDVPILGDRFRSAGGLLVPRTLDFDPFTLHVLEVRTVVLEGRWEPGAHVTIGRVWRGQTAIPSAEAVARTQVDEEGRIAFPRLAGELGSTLRMLVRTKDGTSTFHDVVVAPELRTVPTLDLSLGTDGIVSGPGWTVALLDEPWEGDEATAPPAPERFAALIAQLEWHAGKPERRDANGNSRTELVLRAQADVPWRTAQWALMAAADPRVRMRQVRLGRTGPRGSTYQTLDLPTDDRLTADLNRQAVGVRVTLHRAVPGGDLVIRSGSGGPWTWEEAGEWLRLQRTKLDREGTASHGLLAVPPPGLVTWGEGLQLLAAFRRAGFEDVRLEGAPLR